MQRREDRTALGQRQLHSIVFADYRRRHLPGRHPRRPDYGKHPLQRIVGRRAGILRIMRARLDLPRPGDCRRLGPGVAVSGQLLRQSKRPHLPLYGRAHRHCDRWQSDTSDAGRSGRFRPERNQHRRRQPHHRRRGRRKPRHESGRVEKPRFGPLRPDDHRRLYG